MIVNWIGRFLAPSGENENGNGNGGAATRPARVTPVGNGASLSPLVDPSDVLTFEFGRARRYERALSIVVVAPISWPADHDRGADTDAESVLPLLTAAGLREALRETDIMCYEPIEGRFVLGLTESKGPAARRALERVQTLFKKRLRIDLVVGVAQFPDDGLTLDDLLSAARARAGQSTSIEAQPSGATGAHTPPTRWRRRAGAGYPGLTSDAVGSE